MAVDSDTIAFANQLADASGKVIRPYFRKRIVVTDKGAIGPKPMFDPVTQADKDAETAIRDLIHRERPDDGILGEEHGHEAGTSGNTWILDPIDGTRAFITGRPTWGTLIALHDGTAPVLGIIDQPVLRERYIGYQGSAEVITPDGREPLRTRPCARLCDAVVSTTHPWSYFDRAQRTAFAQVCEASRMSYFGGDCYAYALLAMGFIDCIIEGAMAPWDVAALIPVIEGAGGVVTDWTGAPFAIGAQIIASGDKRVHAQAIALLKGAV
ncbi:MAG TPA: histidinol-phosphatase [Rhizomicrobium sp.]|jgi:myo-inositol-1(or 4)-monophosphatase|nr:histidinol-phosphatase [Rhizomicrobium sp.]HEX4532959.1 histidinol-phosphatase [Rhizomicrobium sp.]